MTGSRKEKTITRRRAVAVPGGMVAAGGVAPKGYKGSIVPGIAPDAESSGARSGGGGTPPSGVPADALTSTPPGDALTDSASPSASRACRRLRKLRP